MKDFLNIGVIDVFKYIVRWEDDKRGSRFVQATCQNIKY